MARGIIEPLPVKFDEAVKRVLNKKPEGKTRKDKDGNQSNLTTAKLKQANQTN